MAASISASVRARKRAQSVRVASDSSSKPILVNFALISPRSSRADQAHNAVRDRIHDRDDDFILANHAEGGRASLAINNAPCNGIQNLPCPDRPCIEEVDAVLLQIGESFGLVPLDIHEFALA